MNKILKGDSLTVLKTLPANSVQTCVTSPPYFGLRDYGMKGQMGLEETPDAFAKNLVEVFREVRRVLQDNGTLWLNLGDSYNGSGKGPAGVSSKLGAVVEKAQALNRGATKVEGLKPKDLIGIPWRVAFALQADGWYLRQDIIWSKPNPMPESVTDRCTKAHEYIFLFSKSPTYYYDNDAVKEPIADSTRNDSRLVKEGYDVTRPERGFPGQPSRGSGLIVPKGDPTRRNRRSVWTVTTKPYKGAHFATFPPDLIEPCILAGAPAGGIVLDPFFGSGTTGAVALKHGREYIGIELNPKYITLAKARLASVQPVLLAA